MTSLSMLRVRGPTRLDRLSSGTAALLKFRGPVTRVYYTLTNLALEMMAERLIAIVVLHVQQHLLFCDDGLRTQCYRSMLR